MPDASLSRSYSASARKEGQVSEERQTPRTDEFSNTKPDVVSFHNGYEWRSFARLLERESDARAERIAELKALVQHTRERSYFWQKQAEDREKWLVDKDAENAKLREALGELEKLKPDFTSPERYYRAVKDIVRQALTGKEGA